MEYMKKFEAKMEKLNGGMESMNFDSYSVNAKISSDDNDSCNSRSRRRERLVNRHEQIVNDPKKNPWDFIKVAQNLDCINYEDLTKVKLIALSFEGYTLIRGIKRSSIESWEEVKQEMRGRLVPSFYKKKLVCEVIENVSRLNRDIQDIVELHDYTFLSILVHQTFKVETHLKRHGRKSYPTTHSNYRGKDKKEEKLLRRDKSPNDGSVPFK
ncbi:hypothetical protein CR513_41144, partial [Mucuna pruriens]